MSPVCGLSEPRLASHLSTWGGPLPGPSGIATGHIVSLPLPKGSRHIQITADP